MPHPPSSRDRLIAAAQELFYSGGIHRSGVDALAVRAGLTKPTLYNVFGSKEALMEAALEDMRRARQEQITGWLDEEPGPRERLWKMVEQHASGMEHANGFRGCPLAVAAQEVPESDPARATARAFKGWVRDQMFRDARNAGLRAPGTLAWGLMMLIEGGTIATYLFDGRTAARHMRTAARALIQSHDPGN